MSETGSAAAESACSCKIGRNVRRYDLGQFDKRLRDRRADGDSLRDLETVVNEAILRAALQEVGTDVVGDVSGIYESLVGDDASAGERTEVRERLAHAGLDVEQLTTDFVSYQTVRTHLRECLDLDTQRTVELSIDDARGTVEWARSRSEGIVERTLERLGQREAFAAGSVEVSQVIRVTCEDCDASYPVDQFLDRGGCDCDAAE